MKCSPGSWRMGLGDLNSEALLSLVQPRAATTRGPGPRSLTGPLTDFLAHFVSPLFRRAAGVLTEPHLSICTCSQSVQ